MKYSTIPDNPLNHYRERVVFIYMAQKGWDTLLEYVTKNYSNG